MRILFFGRYDPAYARNHILMKGLRIQGAQVIECRVRSSARLWPLRLVWRYFMMCPRFDVMVVAFPGQEVMLMARMLTRKPILFDAFTSHYEGYVHDRRKVAPGSMRAHWYHWIDRASCRQADAIITDTQAHAHYFADEFGIPLQKMTPVFVGTDPDILPQAPAEPDGPFTVHFHGTGAPLQGIPTILQAISLLKGQGMVFNLIGINRPRVPYERLASAMAAAHVCLGIFGTTEKTQRVIPNKVFEALAVGRPVITADTPAVRELLDERSAMLIPVGDAQALAQAIVRLRDDKVLRGNIARAGHAILNQRATPAILGAQLLHMCQDLYDRKH